MLGAIGVMLVVGKAAVDGCAGAGRCTAGAVDATLEFHAGSGVLEQAASASAEPASNQRDACNATALLGRSWGGTKTGAKGFVMELWTSEDQVNAHTFAQRESR